MKLTISELCDLLQWLASVSKLLCGSLILFSLHLIGNQNHSTKERLVSKTVIKHDKQLHQFFSFFWLLSLASGLLTQHLLSISPSFHWLLQKTHFFPVFKAQTSNCGHRKQVKRRNKSCQHLSHGMTRQEMTVIPFTQLWGWDGSGSFHTAVKLRWQLCETHCHHHSTHLQKEFMLEKALLWAWIMFDHSKPFVGWTQFHTLSVLAFSWTPQFDKFKAIILLPSSCFKIFADCCFKRFHWWFVVCMLLWSNNVFIIHRKHTFHSHLGVSKTTFQVAGKWTKSCDTASGSRLAFLWQAAFISVLHERVKWPFEMKWFSLKDVLSSFWILWWIHLFFVFHNREMNSLSSWALSSLPNPAP